MINNPSELFKIIAKYQDNKLDENSPVKYAGEYSDFIFHLPPENYKSLVGAVDAVADRSKNPKHDLINVIKGAVLSNPYGTKEYGEYLQSISNDKHTDISAAINSWLGTKFREYHTELFDKLDRLSYINDTTCFDIRSSKNPSEIQQIVKKTNACINDDPLTFFEQVVQDTGTIYLLAVHRDQKESFKDMPKATPDVGYIRLYPYQGEDKKDTLLSVDNIWINNNNKKLVCSLVESLVTLSEHLDMPIIDKTMSTNFIMTNGDKLDVYDQHQSLFKLGHIPQMMRYSGLAIPEKNDGFYIIKSLTNKDGCCKG